MKFLSLLLILVGCFAQAQTYNCTIRTQTDFGASTVSTRALVANGSRRCLFIQNQSSSVVYIKFDTAHSASENMTLAANGMWAPIVIPTNAIYIKSAAGVPTVTVIEGR